MTEYLEIIKSVIPSFEDEHLNEPFSNVGVDSIDLVTIRVDFERKVEKTIPDRDWMTFTSFAEVINYCEDFNTRINAQGTQKPSIKVDRKLIINMPQMAIESLSENWLFKELGKEHWDLLCNGLNANSSDLKDDLGNRLYATFVRIRIQSEFSLRDFQENEHIKMQGSIGRFGGGMYFSEFKFQSTTDQTKFIQANLMTSFSIRNSTGNKELVKSQPSTSINSIENFNQFPAFGNEYRLVKKQELKQIEVNGHSFDIIDTVIFHSEYKLNPYYDLNGVGLLYFASYPTINDCCEANYFNSKRDNNDRWEQTYVTSARDILYYANCDVNDSIIYKLNTHEEVSHTKVKLSSSLYRKSDNKLMARIFTIKNRIL
jgi:probable biosynthetic protein (TIGR04098 family)